MRKIILLGVVVMVTALVGCEYSSVHDLVFDSTPEERAREAMERVWERRSEEVAKAKEVDDFSSVPQVFEKILVDELGFKEGFWKSLVDVYLSEAVIDFDMQVKLLRMQKTLLEKQTEDVEAFGKFYPEFAGYSDELVEEFLYLSFKHPKKAEEEILVLFAESVREGEVSLNLP